MRLVIITQAALLLTNCDIIIMIFEVSIINQNHQISTEDRGYMNRINNTKDPGFWDYMIPGGLLFLSYMVLFYLPQELTLKGWIVFGISVFLFCVGYFGVLQTLPEPESPTQAIVRQIIRITVGVAMFIGGVYYIYIDSGSDKSMAVAVLLLIEAIVMCGFGSESKGVSPLRSQIMKHVYMVLIVVMAMAGCWFFYQELVSDAADGKGRVETATILWVAAGALWHSRRDLTESEKYESFRKNREKNKKRNDKRNEKSNNQVKP